MKKMLRKISCLLVCMCLLILMAVPVMAAQEKIVDQAYLLTDTELDSLSELSDELSAKNHAWLCIVTTNGMDERSIEKWQLNYYKDNQFGAGKSKSGLMLAIDMDSRQWNIMAFGKADDLVTSYQCSEIGETIKPDLSSGNYYDAFYNYLNLADKHLNLSATEMEHYRELDEEQQKQNHKGTSPIILSLSSLIISLFVSAGSVSSMKRSMNTKIRQTGAAQYMKKGSLNLTTKRDIFLYHNVTRTARPRDDSKGSKGSHSGDFHGHSSGGGTF